MTWVHFRTLRSKTVSSRLGEHRVVLAYGPHYFSFIYLTVALGDGSFLRCAELVKLR
jgi:hypothetical protein